MASLFWDSPLGPLTLAEKDGALTHLLFGREILPGSPEEETPLLLRAKGELEEYFGGKRRAFGLPLAPKGTGFQQRVWQALLAIPYGETRSYRQLAEMAGCPKGFRAVGMANHRNPISILIPCHRVIGADGSLTGYGGGIGRKQKLLQLEGALPPTPAGCLAKQR